MRARLGAPAAALAALIAAPALAQEGVGLGLDLQALGLGPKARTHLGRMPPVAAAIENAFGPEFWAKVAVSSAGPAADLSRMAREGCYKLEIIQLLLLSVESGKGLKAVLAERKGGAKLAKIAKDFGLDYDRLYDRALAVEEIVDRYYLPRYPERRARRRDD
ncbi:MAG: hypothetical protein HY748_17565 [Elusimicrobia bacterium]|nr:hypothetical protein [Elusimicrobiota bacterium]